jgi:hypothetical protein
MLFSLSKIAFNASGAYIAFEEFVGIFNELRINFGL